MDGKKRVGVSTACLYPMLTEEALKKLLAAGCQCFEIFLNAPLEMEKPFLTEIKNMLNANGACAVSLHPFTSPIEGMLLFGDYDRRTKQGFDFYKRYMEAAAFLGAKYVVIHGQAKAGRGAGLPDELYWERFGELYRMGNGIGAWPAQENVVNHRSGEPAFIRGMRLHLEENCAFVLDLKQCRVSEVEIPVMAGAMGTRLKHIHISDELPGRPCMLPGTGRYDLAALSDMLDGMKFDGTMVTEVYRSSFLNEEELTKSFELTKKELSGENS